MEEGVLSATMASRRKSWSSLHSTEPLTYLGLYALKYNAFCTMYGSDDEKISNACSEIIILLCAGREIINLASTQSRFTRTALLYHQNSDCVESTCRISCPRKSVRIAPPLTSMNRSFCGMLYPF